MDYISDLDNIFQTYKIKNKKMYETSIHLINELIMQDKKVTKISLTGDKEVLIYTKNEESFKNLVIDEDGDVSYLYIGQNRKTDTKYYPLEKGLDYKKLIDLL